MIKSFIAIAIIPLLISCSCQRKSIKADKPTGEDTTKLAQLPPEEHETAIVKEGAKTPEQLKNEPPSTVQQPISQPKAAVKENLTMVAAVVQAVEILDVINYKLVVKLQTAIPEARHESIVEPGQTVTVYPGYIFDDNKKLDMNNPKNRKLIEMRTLKQKGTFIGHIVLANDMKWYITNVEFFQNAPEGANNEF